MMSEASLFSALGEFEQTRVLAQYAHQLTLCARDGYKPGTECLAHQLVRRLNEVQHRVTGALCDRLANRKERHPDDVLVSIIVGSGDDAFSNYLLSAFRQTWRVVLGTELPSGLVGD